MIDRALSVLAVVVLFVLLLIPAAHYMTSSFLLVALVVGGIGTLWLGMVIWLVAMVANWWSERDYQPYKPVKNTLNVRGGSSPAPQITMADAPLLTGPTEQADGWKLLEER
jgi:hypothetical protein